MSRPTPASLTKPAEAAPPWPDGWPPWPASTATPSRRGRFPTPPVAHVPRPSVARGSQTLGLDREEAARFLAAAASARDHALACLLILNGLRVSEACAADVADLRVERAHRVLAVVGKRGQRTLVPLAQRTVRAIDAAAERRADGPLLMSNTGVGWTTTMLPGSWRGLPAAPGWPSTSPRAACGTPW
jgi:integrase